MVAALLPFLPRAADAAGPAVFINEIHYDNAGADVGEAVEIAGPAGTNLAGWSVALYNGSASQRNVYATITLSGTIPNQQAGFGTLHFPWAGIQNGSPDGLALVDAGSTVIEFLSYEGTFVAASGPAAGMTSTDIGVSQSSSNPVGNSLQLAGSGTMGGDFSWAASQPNTFAAVNTGQTFGIVSGPTDPVINEFVANHTGADSNAFVEVLGDASTSYSTFTVLEIEGDASASGVAGRIDAVLPITTTDAAGYWTDPEDMENGTITILLVENFTGSSGQDLDTNNDGTFDVTPWDRIVDDVATTDGGGSDLTYSSIVLGPFFDGNAFGAGGASRIPDGTDTDTTADWVRNDFDGFGFPGFPGSPAVGEAENTPGAVNAEITVLTDPVGVCGDSATFIHDIQGSGLVSPDVGNIREIEGVVVGDFQGSTGLNGFFVQEDDADVDGDVATSEGIFVFDPATTAAVAIGDVVRVRGTVAEFFSLTRIDTVQSVNICSAGGTASASTVTLPVASINDFEPTEGMAVHFPQTLFASGNFNQGQFGEVDLSVGGPQDNPTNVVAPGTPANALQDLNNRSRIQLDDGSNVQNPLPLPPYIGVGGTLRTGDTVPGLTGVMGFAFGLYEIHPTQAVNFTRVNVRPGVPNVGGTMQVAAYNVLNYFTTLDNAGNICGPAANQGCRGADNAAEFARQKAKLVTAISKLDAEVVGLMEIENNATDGPTADLVAGLNAATAPGTYDYVATGAIGDDAIRVALLYQPGWVTPVGPFAILDSSVDPNFDDQRNRPMLVQTFAENATGALFTVAVNHLKSKGSNCNPDDPDAGDGQGNCNGTRTAAAQSIVDYLATDPTFSGDSDSLIVGDLNAYAQEDPVTTIEAGGYTDLIEAFVGTGFSAGAYSFNFFSQSGYLDHGLSSSTMTPQVTGTAFWHVNADEPRALDYNDFNQPLLFSPDEFRSSDHDPVVIGLALNTAVSQKESARAELSLLLPTGSSQDDHFIQKAIDRIDDSLNPDWWTGPSSLDPKTGNHVFDREHQAVKELEKVVTVNVQTSIDALIDADRQVALKQLTAAIVGDGDTGSIAKAQGNFADAVANAAAGDFAKSVLDYKKAWTNAVKAE
jgi:predicted extracellular nuclease